MTSKIALAGDWHGELQWQKAALHTLGKLGIKNILHAGDYGLGWPKIWPDFVNSAESVLRKYDMYLWVTPGNHENWDYINSREYDGGVHWMTKHAAILERNALIEFAYGGDKSRLIHSLGGAPSIDFHMRTQGISWWKDEVLTYGDVIRAREIGETHDIDIMVTHDAPDGGTQAVQDIIDIPPHLSMFSVEGLRYAAEGRAMMNHAVAGIKPKVFVHGHFHAADMKQDDDTLWVSLGCNRQNNNLALLDLETLQAEFVPLDEDAVEEFLAPRRRV